MANADKGHIEIVNGSIGDLIFRIETLTSDRDTIKICVRAENELSAMKNNIATLEAENARLTAAHAMQGESLVVLPRWMVSNLADKTEAINSAIEDVKYYVGNPSAWEHYDDGVSEKIRAILKAAGMA